MSLSEGLGTGRVSGLRGRLTHKSPHEDKREAGESEAEVKVMWSQAKERQGRCLLRAPAGPGSADAVEASPVSRQ